MNEKENPTTEPVIEKWIKYFSLLAMVLDEEPLVLTIYLAEEIIAEYGSFIHAHEALNMIAGANLGMEKELRELVEDELTTRWWPKNGGDVDSDMSVGFGNLGLE